MHNPAEKRFIITVSTIVVCLLAAALTVFLAKYTRGSLFPDTENEFVKVEYINEGEETTELIAVNGALNLPYLERTGYTFRGWFYDESGRIRANTGNVARSDTSLYALWEINRYTVTAYPNYNNLPSSKTTITYGGYFVIPEPSRIGYSFDGWYYDAEYEEAVLLSTMPARHLTVYAKWRKNNYTVKFMTGEGVDPIADMQAPYNDPIELPVPEKQGFTFMGWYRESGFVNEIESGTLMPANNLVLYARWQANTYYITFNSMLGTPVDPLEAAFGEDISELEVPTPARPGYDFIYWYTDDENTAFVPGTMPLGGITLNAKWEARTDTPYRIEYYFETDDDGGFELSESETESLVGTTDDYRYIYPKTFLGYVYFGDHPDNYTEGLIYGDGSTVFKLYYKKA